MPKGHNKLFKRRLRGAWLSSVISISLVLLLIGAGALLLLTSRRVSDYFMESISLSVVMHPDVLEETAAQFMDKLATEPYVSHVRMIGREEGQKELSATLGEDFLEVFEVAPIPVSLDITLNPAYVRPDSLDVLRARLGGNMIVEDVVYQGALVESLNSNLARMSLAIAVVVALLGFISVMLIANTMRILVFDRRFTIHTMKLVGATTGFIRRPYLGKAAVLGLVSSLVATVLICAVLFLALRQFPLLETLLTAGSLLGTLALVFICGVGICVVSSWFVVGQLIGLDKNDLYY